MQYGARKAVVLRAEVAADASRDVMACVVGVPTAAVARYSLARATLLSTMAFHISPTPLVPFSWIVILFSRFFRKIILSKRMIYFLLNQFLFLTNNF